MSKRPLVPFVLLPLLVALLVPLGSAPANADPLPADYSGSTHGDVLSLGLTATGVGIDAALGHSSTSTDSTGEPRSQAESANLEARAVGIPVDVQPASASSTNATPTDSYDTGLDEVDVPGVLDTGLITGTGSTRWDGDAACVPDGTPMASSSTSVAGATIDLVGLELAELGTVETTGQTTLQAGSVVSTSSGNLSSLSLVNGLVQVEVLTNPTLTASSDGTTGTVTANEYAVAVTIGSERTVLTAGGSIAINLGVPGVLTTDLTLSVGEVTDDSAGATGSGSMTFLRLDGQITGALGNLATVDLGLLPLSATATGAPGGVECTALEPPVIAVPADGATTGERPTISGTGVPGATVTVRDETDTVVGTATVNPDGAWSLVPESPFSVGEHTVTATQTLGDATSGPSNSRTFTVEDLTAPAAPVVEQPADGSTTGDNTPMVSGTGEPGATVEVVIDGSPVGTTTVAPGGTWTFPLTTPLADGEHTVSATQTDEAGNESPGSAANTFTVDTAAPAAPVVTNPADGSIIGDNTPTVTGSGEPGATVEVIVDGSPVGTTTVSPGGTWSLDLTTPLADGPHKVSATQSDEAGNESPASATNTFIVDTTAPAAPVVTTPADGSTTSDTTPTVTGTGEPFATVEVTIDGAVVGTAPVNGAGNWSLELTTPLADGQHTVSATQSDGSGNTSATSAENTFTVDSAAPAAPVVTGPADGSTIADATPTVTGTGEAGATVEVTIDGEVVGTTTVTPEGTWSLELTEPLADGEHAVSATQTDAAGNTSPASPENTFTVDTSADAPVIERPVSGTTTADSTPTISGTGEPGATVEVATGDGTVLGSATVSPDGSWSFDSIALGDGTYTITATQTDEVGNTSATSNSVVFTIDTEAPEAPVIEQPADGSSTDDSTPTVSGTGEPGATVEVSVDGSPVGTTTVNPDGTWSLELTDALADGEHTVTATQTDAAGNTSGDSSVTFTVAAAPAPGDDSGNQPGDDSENQPGDGSGTGTAGTGTGTQGSDAYDDGSLPDTGSPAGLLSLALLGLLVIATGGWLVLWRREEG